MYLKHSLTFILCTLFLLPALTQAQSPTWSITQGNTYGVARHAYFGGLHYRLNTRIHGGDRVNILEPTPQGGWLMIGDGWWEAQPMGSVPAALQSWINAYQWWGQTVDAVAFEPDGDWIIVAGSSYRTSGGIQSSFFGTFTSALGRGERVRSIAFDSDGNGWVVATDQQTYQMNIPGSLYRALYDCRLGDRPVRTVKFVPGMGNGWYLATDRWATTSEGYGDDHTPAGMAEQLLRFNRMGRHVDVASYVNNGWVVLSNNRHGPATALVDQVFENLGNNNVNIIQRMQDLNIPGLSIALVRNHQILAVRGYGVLENGQDDVVTSRTRFPAASLSKAVASATLLTLVEDNLLGLDEPLIHTLNDPNNVDGNDLIGRWFRSAVVTPDPDDWRYRLITPRMLLSHTAGLSRHGIGLWPLTSTVQLEDFLLTSNGRPNTTLIHDLITRYDYSGGGFCVAEALMEAAADSDFETLARDRVLFPLGMYRSSFTRNVSSVGLARGHAPDMTVHPVRFCPGKTAGGLTTTAMDYARFLNCISLEGRRNAQTWASDRILEATTVRNHMLRGIDDTNGDRITSARTTPSPFAPYWTEFVPCLGINASTQTQGNGFRFVEHGGSQRGFRNQFFLHPQSGTGYVVFINKDHTGGGQAMMNDLYDSFRFVFRADFW